MTRGPPPGDDPPAGSTDPAADKSYFVVGIGASAGGLEAVSSLLRRTTVDGAAFVVVQHLAPNQSSMLTELLGRASILAVETAVDGAVIKPNHVYVSPPNAVLALEGANIRLVAPSNGARPEMPIDAFFRSLADNRGIKAMGVVMSGTGTDGTFGLAAIKAAGGITFVQEPSSARFDGMPRSAQESGSADFCLKPEEIADEILRVSTHPYLHSAGSVAPPLFDEFLGTLAGLLKTSFGIDLAHYKPKTIERRIQRRMAVHRIERFDQYLRLCQSDHKELSDLHKDLLINVTSFFRDKEPFEILCRDIIPRLLEGKNESNALRIWVPGCSSGEEAYSIAMCVLEVLDEKGVAFPVQIFGTDLDTDAVQQARRGLYPSNIVADVPIERLRRFFIKSEDGHYQVVRRVRDLIVFSTQNISRDPPFSKLDLISCRNLLMYLQPAIQKKVLRILHYALKPAGFLMLGHSESVGEASELFALVDRNNRIYTSKHVSLATPMEFGANVTSVSQERHPLAGARPMLSLAHLADRKILEQYAPPGVVVNESLDIVYFRGSSERYLQQPSGVATHNVLRLVRPELYPSLKSAIQRVQSTSEPVTTTAYVKSDTDLVPFTLIAQPMLDPETKARCLLVLFKEGVDGQAVPHPAPSPAVSENPSETGLSQELALAKEYLQSTIEEIERTNEDLQSANEELQSSNEELQSSNEELETSQEELQSTNEELITLNEELQSRMRELSSANDDLHNLLLGVDRAIIIVGLDLRIRRFTHAAEKLLDLLPTDIGRSATQLNSFIGGFGIDKVINESITQLSTIEREVHATDGKWYSLRVVPYRTLDLIIRGAVITVVDVDLSKRRTDLAAAAEEYAAEGLAAIQHPLMIVDATQVVIWVNDFYYQAFHLTPPEIIGTRLARIGAGWSDPELEKRITDTAHTGAPFRGHSLTLEREGAGAVSATISGSRLRSLANQPKLVLLAVEGEFGLGGGS